MRTTLLHDRAVKLSKAKVRVSSDSVLGLGKIHEHPQSIEAWKQKIEWFTKSREYRELDGIDGEQVEFERRVSQDTTLQLLREIHKKMAESRIRPEQIEDRIIFMPMYNDIGWTRRRDTNMCFDVFTT